MIPPAAREWRNETCAGHTVSASAYREYPPNQPLVLVQPPADKWNKLTPDEARKLAGVLVRAAAHADGRDVRVITLTPQEHELAGRVLDVCDPASDCEIGNDEIGEVRAILARLS